ncbi:putative internal virion protein [uncultured Mediterranean phage uvMED]|nr:putative internal virion protein [uncultured Mediterranean phage uvMED]
MGITYSQAVPFTYEDAQKKALDQQKVYSPSVTQAVTDLWDGFKEENLLYMAYDEIANGQKYEGDAGYSYVNDPQLEGYEQIKDQFMFSRNAQETTDILAQLKHNASIEKESPYYFLGRITGAIADPSSYLLFSKAARSAKVFGTAATTEEIIKQNLDPLRDDSFVPIVGLASFVIPAVINKFTTPVPEHIVQKSVKLADDWIPPVNKNSKKMVIKELDGSTKIYEDGVLVNPNKIDTAPSGVGAAVNTDTKNLSTAGKRLEGEAFVKSYFSRFGEEGPWTPVFRVMKSATTNGRKMMSDILDTPLLKLKNTKDWGFQSTGASLEVQLKMEEVAVIESMKDIKTAYIKYLESIGQTKPKTEIGANWRNTLNTEAYSMSQFSQEIVRARIMGKHPNQFVEEAARVTQEKVYGPLMEQIKKYKLREAPVEQELAAMESVLKMLRDTKQVSKVVKSKIDGKTATWTVEQLEAQIKKLTERLANIRNTPDGVKNYINIIYNKTAIDNNPVLFKKIIKDFLVRKNITMNEAKLNKLVEDLSGHFPFTRFEKRSWDKMLVKLEAVKNGGIKELNEIIANERFLFNRPRYARASKARNLNLDAEAQLALLDAGMIGNDIFALQKAYYRQIVPDILLTKKYGDTSGMGYKYVSEAESMTEPGLLQVAAEYNMKIGFTQNKAKRLALVKEKNQVLGDLEAAVELLRGTYGLPSNPHHWTSVAMRTMKHYNALTMLTGFAAAIPDAARVVMTSGIKRGFQTQFEMLADAISGGSIFKLGKKEAQSWGEAVDLITNQRAMLFADMPSDMFGFVNKMESAMGKTSQFNFMYINLMSRWTEMAKSMASVTIGSRIIEDSIKWGKGGLSDKWKTALASSGIDKQMAKRIAVQFETHGTKLKHNFIAGTSEWTDDAAKKAFGAALNKDINITIVTPGKGDTALWMSTELGSTIAQFKKFAAAASQRILLRGMQERDADFLFGSMLLLGSGMMIDGLYHKYRFNRDYGKLSLSEKLINAFDRSGLAGIYSDVNKAIETLTDNRFGISPLLGAGKPYGSSTRWKMGTILGPSGGQIYNIFDIIYDVAGGKYNHHTAKNVRRLIPWQNVWYLDWLFDDIQKGLK